MTKFGVFVLKELAESAVRNFRKLKSLSLNMRTAPEVKALAESGVYVRSSYLSASVCSELIELIDNYIESDGSNVWVDDEQSDHRLYFINEIDSRFQGVFDDPYFKRILAAHTGTFHPSGMLLAAKLLYKPDNRGSGGGWHRDSPFQHQFKAICYLNDVCEENGPFEFIKGSHRKKQIFMDCLRGFWKPGQYRFTDVEVDRYLKGANKEIETVCGPAGSLVFADTKGIHRGRPISSGVRYVLFCYYWHGQVPEHFNKLRQHVS